MTIYLSPRDYHRVHMPWRDACSRQLGPGKLFSVNQVTAENVPRLFARNERLVCYFDTAAGPMAWFWSGGDGGGRHRNRLVGQVAPPTRNPVNHDYAMLPRRLNSPRVRRWGDSNSALPLSSCLGATV